MAGDDGEEDRELAFSAGGRYVAVALQGGDVAVWDLHPLPHAALYLEAPPQLAEEDGCVGGAGGDGWFVWCSRQDPSSAVWSGTPSTSLLWTRHDTRHATLSFGPPPTPCHNGHPTNFWPTHLMPMPPLPYY